MDLFFILSKVLGHQIATESINNNNLLLLHGYHKDFSFLLRSSSLHMSISRHLAIVFAVYTTLWQVLNSFARISVIIVVFRLYLASRRMHVFYTFRFRLIGTGRTSLGYVSFFQTRPISNTFFLIILVSGSRCSLCVQGICMTWCFTFIVFGSVFWFHDHSFIFIPPVLELFQYAFQFINITSCQ